VLHRITEAYTAVKEWGCDTRKTFAVAMAVLIGIMLALPASALALRFQTPDDTPMVVGRGGTIEQVGTNVWLGGRISQVKRRDGTVLGNAGNLAVLQQDPVSGTEKYISIAPNPGGTGAEVRDVKQYGKTGNLLIAGKFAEPTSTEKNLVLFNGDTGKVIRWYNSRPLKTVPAAPGPGRVYGGG
jgi:hypothetical protein